MSCFAPKLCLGNLGKDSLHISTYLFTLFLFLIFSKQVKLLCYQHRLLEALDICRKNIKIA
jgi:hypothetical protein